MKRPLADARPLGPFAQKAHEPAEVIIYFSLKNLAPKTVDETKAAIQDMAAYEGPVTGIHGVNENVVSLQTTSNRTTHSDLMQLTEAVEDETGIDIEEIEVIW